MPKLDDLLKPIEVKFTPKAFVFSGTNADDQRDVYAGDGRHASAIAGRVAWQTAPTSDLFLLRLPDHYTQEQIRALFSDGLNPPRDIAAYPEELQIAWRCIQVGFREGVRAARAQMERLLETMRGA